MNYSPLSPPLFNLMLPHLGAMFCLSKTEASYQPANFEQTPPFSPVSSMCLLYTNQLLPCATLVADLTQPSAHIPASGISAHESSVTFLHFTMRNLGFLVFVSASILESLLVLTTHPPLHLYNFDRFSRLPPFRPTVSFLSRHR